MLLEGRNLHRISINEGKITKTRISMMRDIRGYPGSTAKTMFRLSFYSLAAFFSNLQPINYLYIIEWSIYLVVTS